VASSPTLLPEGEGRKRKGGWGEGFRVKGK